MTFEVIVLVLLTLTTLSSLVLWIFFLKLLERVTDLEEDSLPEDTEKKIELNLTTRLRDLQTRQFSLDMGKPPAEIRKNDAKR